MPLESRSVLGVDSVVVRKEDNTCDYSAIEPCCALSNTLTPELSRLSTRRCWR